MRSEALDITIESRGSELWLFLSGPFHNEQVPSIKEKITGLIEDGNRRLAIDLEQVIEIGDQAVPMFLALLNLVKGKRGELKFVFKNRVVSDAFAPYRNILQIFPDVGAASRGGLMGSLRYRSKLLSRRTGVRISRPVAIVLLVALGGWFLSLAIIIQLQSRRIHEQENSIVELTQWKQQRDLEISSLKERLRPLQQLGIIIDTAAAERAAIRNSAAPTVRRSAPRPAQASGPAAQKVLPVGMPRTPAAAAPQEQPEAQPLQQDTARVSEPAPSTDQEPAPAASQQPATPPSP